MSNINFNNKKMKMSPKIKDYSWILVPIIAVGGLFYPKLGLLLVPIMGTIMIMGFFTGKFWCGNLCPHGGFFDKIVAPFSKNKKIPQVISSRAFKIAFFLFFMGMFSIRTMRVISLWGSLYFLDKLGFIFAFNYLMPTIIGTVLALFVKPRAWCTFCPMGTMEQLAYKLGKTLGINKKTDKKVTSLAQSKCIKCSKCANMCPLQLKPYLDLSNTHQFENENCIRCAICVENCPVGILTLATTDEAKKLTESSESVA